MKRLAVVCAIVAAIAWAVYFLTSAYVIVAIKRRLR